MNQRKHLTLVAAGAALLAAIPLVSVFERWTWLIDSLVVVAAMCGAALLVRSLRAPNWAPTAAMAAAALVVLTWLFPSHAEFAGVVPSPGTFKHFNELLATAATEMSQFAAPVADRNGFLFLTTVGVALVAVVVDLFAVVLRRPALAGLPMLAIYSVPVAVSEGSVSVLPFVLGAAGFLWLLVTDNVDRVRRFGRRFTGDGRDVDLWEPSPLAAAGQRLGLIGVILAVVLPLAVPGMTTGLLARFGSGTGPGFTGGGKTGNTVSLNATLAGYLNRDKSIEMLKVTNINDPKPFYVRFGTADELRPDGFFNRQLPAGSPINRGIPEPDLASGVPTNTYRASFEVLNLEMSYLPVYTYPTKVEKFSNAWFFDKSTTTIFSGKENTKKKKYTVDYIKPEFTDKDLRKVPPLPNDNPLVKQFTATPTSIQFVKARVQEYTAGKTTQYDKVKAIFDSFSTENGFVYDLSTDPNTSGSKIVDFLQQKHGYCVQYAAAMAWLLREAKIPARVAFGFTQGGTRQGNSLILTSFNLHAWTEAYFQGYGWVPFDPTPASAVNGSVSPQWAPNPSQPDTSDPNNDNDVPRPGQSAQAGPNARPSDQAAAPGGNGGNGSPTRSAGDYVVVGGVAAGGLALLLLLGSPALVRFSTRRRRLSERAAAAAAAGPPGRPVSVGRDGAPVLLPPDDPALLAARDQAHRAWDELLDTMTDYHVMIDDAESPRATGARLIARERLRDQAESGLRMLSTAEEHARYARRPITGAELRGSLSAVRSAFAVRSNRRTRMMAVLLPPSVVQRWRMSTWRRFTDLSNGLGRAREGVVRALSVRRMVTRKAR